MRFRILELCKEAGINQTELADKIGLSRVGLSKAINGNPTVDTLERIANALNVPITELFAIRNNELFGHVEYKGIIYRINSFEDMEKVLKLKEE
ncbi:helix-turn-helix domain-containing protein [Parabacteroides pacaensis]|uniref:helix-turn-helix domain-containing protein n=1 Tax=Parabacteroides pacaensis TaxID=2086575 RepID=UPI000D10558E|nr:helix-turn-helix transcriptional regulator [Parabacteroides pacaensis]